MATQIHLIELVGAIGLVAVVCYAIVTCIRQRLIGHRLELLAEDIRSYGRSSLTTHLQACDFCQATSHVQLWQYGNTSILKEVFVCYLCARRIDKHLDPSFLTTGVKSHDT